MNGCGIRAIHERAMNAAAVSADERDLSSIFEL